MLNLVSQQKGYKTTLAPTSIRVPPGIWARRCKMLRESGIRAYITAEEAWQSGYTRNHNPLNNLTTTDCRTTLFHNCHPKNNSKRLTRWLRFDCSCQIDPNT